MRPRRAIRVRPGDPLMRSGDKRARMTEAVIRVQGRGEVSAEPDLVVLAFQVRGEDTAYGEAVARAARLVDRLRGGLEAQGIARTDLKTTNFGVEADYQWLEEQKQRVFRGYVATHGLRLELGRTVDAGAVLDAIAREAPGVEVRVSFEIRDRQGFRQRLLAAAVASARQNATTIAAAADLRLGAVVGIEYGWTEVRYESTLRLEAPTLSKMAEPATSFEPEEVRGRESVTISYAIGGPADQAP